MSSTSVGSGSGPSPSPAVVVNENGFPSSQFTFVESKANPFDEVVAVGREIRRDARVLEAHAHVEHGDGDVRAAGRDGPRFGQVDHVRRPHLVRIEAVVGDQRGRRVSRRRRRRGLPLSRVRERRWHWRCGRGGASRMVSDRLALDVRHVRFAAKRVHDRRDPRRVVYA